VASSYPKPGVDTNPTVAINTNVSDVGDKSSYWSTLSLPSNIMPLDHNEGVITMKSCSNVALSNPKPVVDTNPMVAMNHQCQ